ncbi:MAG: histidine kinase [Saprospiraceae bacterium]|nr:histidine kinase [Saprospiraceae bacterium]
METLQDVPVFRSESFDLNRLNGQNPPVNDASQSPDVILENQRFESNQTKLTLTIIVLWTIVQLITFTKNLFIYNILSEPMEYSSQITKRLIPLLAGIIFILIINRSGHFILRQKVKLTRMPLIHFIMASSVSICIFIASVFIVNRIGMNTFENSSVLKYFMVEIDRLFLIYLLISIMTTAHFYFHEVRLKELELARAEKAYQQAQIISLNNEVNPHMISNTLNNISTLISTDIHEAKKMIVDFANLLRQNLKNKESIYTTLYHEKRFIKNYINLQNIDRQNKYKISFNFSEDLNSAILPKMILQPLVENAIKHSSLDSNGILKVQISAELVDQNLQIIVKNKTGKSEKISTTLSNIGIGTENIMKRLKLLYRNNFKFDLYENETFFTCLLIIPFSLDTTIAPT